MSVANRPIASKDLEEEAAQQGERQPGERRAGCLQGRVLEAPRHPQNAVNDQQRRTESRQQGCDGGIKNGFGPPELGTAAPVETAVPAQGKREQGGK